MPTAIVRVLTKNGQKIRLKALVDPGSQSSIITEHALQLLALPTESVSAGVEGVSDTEVAAKKRVALQLSPRFSDNYVLNTKALVFKKITNLSVFKGDLKEYNYLQNLSYADPTINDENKIDILLGVADFARILKQGLLKGEEHEPIAMNSKFGWLVLGPDGGEKPTNQIKITTLLTNVEIEENISKFFESEDVNNDDSDDECELSEEEKFCEKFYVETTRRDDNGKFVVSMPYKNGKEPVLGDSKKLALATLFQLAKKFAKSPELRKQYTEAIHDQIEKGHMVLVETPPENAHYIAHHAVFKESTTTKLRAVYNASQKTSNGLSLNEQLAIGKLDQPTIFTLMIRWRKPKIAIIADLEKMYKQIRLNADQQHLQMILWRDTVNEKIKHYKLTTVSFGVASSPFLAIRTLREIANTVESEYPDVANAINNCFYVDDYTGGADTVEKVRLFLFSIW